MALTCYLVDPGRVPRRCFADVGRTSFDFGIPHATLQVETAPDLKCALAPDHVV